jgi:hypothetical protein
MGGAAMVQTLERPTSYLSVAGIIDYWLDHLRQEYVWRDGDDVEAFLRQHPLLIDALVEARGVIAEYFGSETPVRLEVMVDPEAIGVQELAAVILSSHGPEETLARMARLTDEWWLDASQRFDDELLITFGCV